MDDPPRYQPLRALPERAYVPGRNERSADHGQSASPAAFKLGAERWAENEQYLWGVDLYNNGFFWEAHEAWESLWRAAAHDVVQHAFLQALILCAAACLKGVQHDREAAKRVAARALQRLEHVQSEHSGSYMGIDLGHFRSSFCDFIDRDPTAVAGRPQIVLIAQDSKPTVGC